MLAAALGATLLAGGDISHQPSGRTAAGQAPLLSTQGEPFPTLDLAQGEVGLTVDGIPYPVAVVQGHLEFTRRQAARAGGRGFYEWGEILHLYDTAAERVLAARAAWDAGFRVSDEDLRDFSSYTIDASPGYLEELYGGSRDLFVWDARLQILMKKWMAYVAHGQRDVTWLQAGDLMSASAAEFAAWEDWYRPIYEDAEIITFPERLERQGEGQPRWGIVFLAGLTAGGIGLGVRSLARSEAPKRDLLTRLPALSGLVRRRIYPEGVRLAVLAVFLVMLSSLAFGSAIAHRNLGSVYLWILWWPLVPFLLFFAGRSWCAVCPAATLGDMAQRLPFSGRRRPRWLALAGVWLIDGTFIAITWLDRTLGLVSSVRLTLTALLLLVGACLTVSLVFQRRTFCRHVCFFGAFAGNYSLASLAELRPSARECRGCLQPSCLRKEEASACAMLERPRALSSSRDCNLCLVCTRTCSRRSLALRLRDPLSEIANIRRPHLGVAVLAAILVGVVAVQNLGMLEVAGVMERRLQEATGLGRTAVLTALYLLALTLPLALLVLASGFKKTTMATFGYMLIPLDLGAHAAHNLLHLLGEGRSIWWVTAELVGFSSPLGIPGGHPGGSLGAALLDMPTIKALQIGLLLLAALGSLMVTRRLARRLRGEMSFAPAYLLLGAFVAANLWLFSSPMALRH